MSRAGRLALRPGPLRAAAGLAAIFVVARVAYRVLFDGASGTGPVLLPLPRIPLPPPYSWVTLLGPVTADGLWDAVLSALPVASVILLFGVLNALFDVSRLFGLLARGGPLRGVARALAVAWSTLPALGAAVRRVRVAQRLRGERAGPRMLVPVLERTLERAAAIANGLELRGFGAAAGGPAVADADGAQTEQARRYPVTASHVELGFAARRVLSLTRLTLTAGTLAVVTGPTGSGKSTLLRALAGLHDHVDGGWSAGAYAVVGRSRRETPPRDTARLVGVVLQNPREGFCTERVRDEIGLALQLRGVASADVAARVTDVAGGLGLSDLLDRSLPTLSAGEATLVAIAAAVVDHPALLLIDEPLADLDAETRPRVVAALDHLAHREGVCVLVAEHRWEAFGDAADSWWSIDTDAGALVVRSGAPEAPAPPAAPARPAPSGGDPVLAAAGLHVEHGETVAVRDATFSLAGGEIAALIGPNGAGKSSLLMALALPAKEMTGLGRAALVPDASDDLFTRDTVADECARADRVARRSGGAAPAADRFAALLGLDDASLAERLCRHPLDLSLGERRCLAMALQLSRSPRALLVDEPTRGLDAAAREQVRVALVRTADAGAAVLIATHDQEFADALGARVLPMRDGIVPALPVAGRAAEAPEPRGVSSRSARSTNEWGTSAERSSPVERGSAASETKRGEIRATEVPSGRGASSRSARSATRWPESLRRRLLPIALVAANLVALASFTWPLLASALPSQAEAAAPWAALALVPVAALVVLAALDESVRSAHTLAYLSVLAAIGTAVRIASTGVGGVEAVFILLILAGRAFGARFGMLLGVATIALSSTVFGGYGPWTPFQMFACAWVGAGAGLLPRRLSGRAELALLCVYGVVASYVFGLLMNIWFWPFAVGTGTAISYVPGAPLGQNLGSFLLYSLVTSTAGWDTLRAITTVIGVVLIGRPVLAALGRAKPVAPPSAPTTAATPLPVAHAPAE